MDCSPQSSLSMGFPRKEYWGGLHFFLQGIFSIVIKPGSPALKADSLLFQPPGKTIVLGPILHEETEACSERLSNLAQVAHPELLY